MTRIASARLGLMSAAAAALSVLSGDQGWAKPTKASVIHLEMTDATSDGMTGSSQTMAATLDRESVPPGLVTIVARNSSKLEKHEMVLARLAHAGAPLPVEIAKDKVDESKIQRLGEIEDLAPGASGTLTRRLSSGSYVLLCNRTGHYHAGMWTNLTVTSDEASSVRTR